MTQVTRDEQGKVVSDLPLFSHHYEFISSKYTTEKTNIIRINGEVGNCLWIENSPMVCDAPKKSGDCFDIFHYSLEPLSIEAFKALIVAEAAKVEGFDYITADYLDTATVIAETPAEEYAV